MKKNNKKIRLDDRNYYISVYQKQFHDEIVPRLLIPAYQPTKIASQLLRTCIRTIQQFTPESFELWVIDNNSPQENNQWLLQEKNINVVLNRTEPLPRELRKLWFFTNKRQMQAGSYANAIGLEIGLQVIDPKTHFILPMHMDTMPCKHGWMSYLRSKISDQVRIAGVRLDRARVDEGVLHVLAFLVDFQLFKQLNLNFFPDLPNFDVGDKVTVEIRKAGFDIFAAKNSLRDEEVFEKIPEGSVYKSFNVDRSIDEEGDVFFLHLGRGTPKSSITNCKGITIKDWLTFSERLLDYER